MPETLKPIPQEPIEIFSATPEWLEVEATYTPGEPPPRHRHPSRDEDFAVLSGAVIVALDRPQRELTARKTIETPRRTVHRIWI